MKKSKFKLTHLHSTTLDPGYLVPFCLIPTLPNDSFRIGLSTFIRAQPMLAPLMHEVRLFTQYWFVPNRIIWDEWEDFITGGNDLSLTPPFPTVKLTANDCKTGSLTDYFGFPLVQGLEVSALPYRAMAEIWNTRYRDEDLQEELPIDYGSSEDTTTPRKLLSPSFSKDYFTTARPFTQRGGDVLVPVSDAPATGSNTGYEISFQVLVGYIDARETARPNSNTAPNATGTKNYNNFTYNYDNVMSLVSNFLKAHASNNTLDTLVGALGNDPQAYSYDDYRLRFAGNVGYIIFNNGSGNIQYPMDVYVFVTNVTPISSNSTIVDNISSDIKPGDINKTQLIWGNFGTNPSQTIQIPHVVGETAVGDIIHYARFVNGFDRNYARVAYFPGLAEGTLDFSQAYNTGNATISVTQQTSGFTVRDLRRSAALQRYAERSLKYGNRYEEFIQREFGIKPRDYRIQRPEYLGGGSGILNISEVLQTAESADTGVGTMRGHGVASISQRPIRFRCPEHGIILGLLSIRPKSVYTQGVDREWLKRSRLDFFTPELANIGMQEVLQQELFATADNANEVFGYSERYQEYRYQKPLVTSEFRTTLNFWNMARLFANAPNLNAEFIDMANAVDDFKRPFQIQDNSAHAFICMLKNHIRAYRPIPKRAKDILK